MNKILIAATAFFAGVLFNQFWSHPLRFALMSIYQSEYEEHVYQCDNAMREHFLAKTKARSMPSEQTLQELDNTELALIDCHEYDKFRKGLLSVGLTENDLSEMGLQAIESTRRNLQEIVGQHEIRY